LLLRPCQTNPTRILTDGIIRHRSGRPKVDPWQSRQNSRPHPDLPAVHGEPTPASDEVPKVDDALVPTEPDARPDLTSPASCFLCALVRTRAACCLPDLAIFSRACTCLPVSFRSPSYAITVAGLFKLVFALLLWPCCE